MSVARAAACAMYALAVLMVLDAPLDGQVRQPADPSSPSPPRNRGVTPSTARAVVCGRIVRADTGAPLRRVEVTLAGEPNLRRRVTTDRDGRYEFADLSSGRFTITAARGGYLALQYGQRRPFEPGRPIEVRESQVLDDIDFSLTRASVISGRITNEGGEPVVGAEISVERYQYTPEGHRRLNRVSVGIPIGPLRTDDRGEFRAFGLMPGEYVVSASVRMLPVPPGQDDPLGPAQAFLPTYYPGTATSAEAQGIQVGLAQEVPVQFSLRRGRVARISGIVIDSSGQPAAGASLMLASPTANALGASGTSAGSVAADGAFSIGNVPPGEHFIQVRLPPRPGVVVGPEVANVPISATGADVTGFRIATAPGTTVLGHVEWEGTAPRTGADRPLRIVTSAADGRPALIGSVGSIDPSAIGTVGADGAFRIGSILGSVLFSAEGVPPQWSLKAVVVNGVDVTAVPTDASSLSGGTRVRVVLTDRLTEISGTVRTARREPAREYVVVVLPEAPVESTVAARYMRTARADQRGAFRLRALPPGRYVVAAVEALEQGAEWDPVFQASVRPSAQRVTLTEGQTLALQLDLLP